MPMYVVIPDKDPLITLLEQRAVRRRLSDGRDKKQLRKRLPRLARALISERLSDLEAQGDSLEPSGDVAPSVNGDPSPSMPPKHRPSNGKK